LQYLRDTIFNVNLINTLFEVPTKVDVYGSIFELYNFYFFIYFLNGKIYYI